MADILGPTKTQYPLYWYILVYIYIDRDGNTGTYIYIYIYLTVSAKVHSAAVLIELCPLCARHGCHASLWNHKRLRNRHLHKHSREREESGCESWDSLDSLVWLCSSETGTHTFLIPSVDLCPEVICNHFWRRWLIEIQEAKLSSEVYIYLAW